MTRHEPRGVGPPATQWGAAMEMTTPIYGPSGGSYGDDYADIDEMVLCSKVLALAALELSG